MQSIGMENHAAGIILKRCIIKRFAPCHRSHPHPELQVNILGNEPNSAIGK
jgi:hypothetical protein